MDFRDLDQKLFGWIWGVVKRARTKARRGSAVDLAMVESRLSILASVVAERRIELVPTVDRGGPQGDVLRLPVTLDVFTQADENTMLYVLRVVLDASLVRLGVQAASNTDANVAAFASVLLVPSLLHVLGDELPGVLRIVEHLRASMLERLANVDCRSPQHEAWHAALSFALTPKAPARLPLTDADCAHLRTLGPLECMGRAFRVAARLARTPSKGAPFDDVGLPIIGPFPRMSASIALSADVPAAASTSSTERTAPARDVLRRIELSENPEDDNPLVHSFEKVHTLEEYKGGQKALDGEDELREHESALDEVALREVVRTNAPSKSTYRMEVLVPFGGSAEETPSSPESRATFYDEWGGRAYRERYCRVVEEVAKDAEPGHEGPRVPANRVRRVRRVFEALEDARRLRLRQPSGSEVDVDAVVARYAFTRAGKEGDHRLYAERRPVEHDVATLLLLDVSSSSDGWLDGRHVIALEREAAACIGDALTEIHAPFAVAGFYSHTHRDCRFVHVKRFREPWRAARARLSAIEPSGYTRIGPAIRHATALLAREPARRRALLIVTDGRPTDYDQYEGRYGIEDVRMALHEAVRVGVTPFSLCIANARTSHLEAMFGATGFELVSAPEALAEKLVAAQVRFRSRTGLR